MLNAIYIYIFYGGLMMMMIPRMMMIDRNRGTLTLGRVSKICGPPMKPIVKSLWIAMNSHLYDIHLLRMIITT